MTPLEYRLQRLTAFVLAPLVLVHLGLIIFAVQDGLSGEEILARTRGSFAWAAFYGVFVLAAAVHGAIGIAQVIADASDMPRDRTRLVGLAIGSIILILGARAVAAIL